MPLERVLFVPDAHIPYHDERAWDLMLDVGHELAPEVVIVLGDLADFYGASTFSKDPTRLLRLDQEVDAVHEALDQLDALSADTRIFIEGNHEDRLRRYLQDKAPELFGFIDTQRLLRLAERGWEFIPYKEDTKLGALYLTHDIGVAGRYSAYRCLEAYQHSVVTAHTHRLAYIVEGDARGDAKVSAQFGWLGDKEKADYKHRIKANRDWALGFGIGYHDTDTGVVYLAPVPIVNYTCIVEGVLYAN